MTNDTLKIALLIDGDNAQPRLLEQILSETGKYGKATIRRIYGDWTSPSMNGWKTMLNHFAIRPMQKFSYTSGKNSTDSALIIDAMDILHSGLVNGFCIVSSDSDYTGLAHRIREEGVFVMGIGQAKTPQAFVKACEIFIFTENLADKDEEVPRKTKARRSKRTKENGVKTVEDTAPAETEIKTEEPKKRSRLNRPLDIRVINKAFDMVAMENETAYLADLGNALTKLDPSFDVRTYGFRSLAQLFKSLSDQYEVMPDKTTGSGMFTYLVKRKGEAE
jgi:uncharacterized LabA/DUF88 family protein